MGRGEQRQASFINFWKLIKELLPTVAPGLAIYAAGSFVYELLKLAPPYLIKLLIDAVIYDPNTRTLAYLVLGIFGILTILLLLEVFFLGKMARLAVSQQLDVLERTFNKLTELPLSWHEKHHTGTLVSKVTKAAGHVHHFIWFMGENILPIILQVLLTAGALLWVDWRIGLIYVALTPLLLWMIDRQFKGAQPLRQQYHEAYDESTRELSQTLANIQTVKDYAQEEREAKIHQAYLNHYQQYHQQRVKYEEQKIVRRDLFTNVIRVGTLGVAVYLVIQGILTPGDLVFVFTLTEKAYINLFRLGRVYAFMGDTHESLERVRQINATKSGLPDEGKKRPRKGDIKLEHVNFTYGDDTVLHNLNLTFTQGNTTAIIGPSGGGKTTLVKLLTRQYDPTTGRITIGGQDIKESPLKALRQRMAFVSQHTEIFDRTVQENIAYAKPGATKAAVIRAAKKAHAHKFITTFPQQYETVVGERGVRLSGGQQQRISIARALLADTDIIIFDEATSSLDSESEQEIQKAILGIKDKTIIIIAHRLSTVEHADEIIVLQNGKVAEQGTHQDLLQKKKGIYKRMRSLQSLGELRA